MGTSQSYPKSEFELSNGSKGMFYDISSVEEKTNCKVQKLPFSIRVLLEGALRNCDGFLVTEKDVENIAEWTGNGERLEIPFMPSRVILQDFTGFWHPLRDFTGFPHVRCPGGHALTSLFCC